MTTPAPDTEPTPVAQRATASQPAPETQPTWRRSVRDVVVVAVVVVGVVLGLSLLTGLLPADVQRSLSQLPWAIVVLIAGTGWVLWRIVRRPPSGDGP